MTEKSPLDGRKFLADVMLGSLAKWLRILGYDVAYDNRIDDEQIIRRSRAENRIVLTRDTRLVRRRRLGPSLFIHSNHLWEQIREVLDFLRHSVDPARLLTRCVECNTLLDSVSKEEVRERVPPYVYQTQSRFKSCPGCRRTYWGGTHREKILERLLAMEEERKNKRQKSGELRNTRAKAGTANR